MLNGNISSRLVFYLSLRDRVISAYWCDYASRMENRKKVTLLVPDRSLASLNINAGSNGDGNALHFLHARRPVKSSSPRNAARRPIVARRRIARRTPLRAFPRDDEIRSALRYRDIALFVLFRFAVSFPLFSSHIRAFITFVKRGNRTINQTAAQCRTLSWREINYFFIVLSVVSFRYLLRQRRLLIVCLAQNSILAGSEKRKARYGPDAEAFPTGCQPISSRREFLASKLRDFYSVQIYAQYVRNPHPCDQVTCHEMLLEKHIFEQSFRQ